MRSWSQSHVMAAVLAAACAAGSPPAAGPPPTPAAPAPLPPSVTPPPMPPESATIEIGPQRSRFVAHQRVEIHNDYAGMPPEQLLEFRSWFTATVGPALDSAGRWATTFVIDSLVADSATALPPTFNLAAARGLAVQGWLTTTGELQDAVFSDSATAQNLGRLLGWFRRFFPYVPVDGFREGGEWTDSLTTTEPGLGATITRTSTIHMRATGWELRDSAPALRVEVTETYAFSGSGEGGGQPMDVQGSGFRRGVEYVTDQGEYTGGVSHDTASLTITLPQQGITIPQRQIGTLTVTRLPL